ncbi:DNA repair protein RecN [Dokdonia sp. Hel_I_53]|uniref:DNA repair protein RecN n=1 Tax=Dokdonia sp. Hel_I_53 TaxID=1566287 RepID=UPI00119A8447|nr:DNA repair protein RecN [Dokdonia sp. Hel_I_53]TVZ53270.1 DNA replication and repair protein RecN [Dokdonia sp. Hel_I_53]
MLQSLSIKNYALIEKVQLDFKEGFTVITGETGAGKSILLGALGLITGKRADSSSAGVASEKCIVEGVFAVKDYNLEYFFKRNDLDYEVQTIIRRELLPSGKSRAFINDTPVTLSQLASLGALLVDIHSQHKTLEVVENEFQFNILDTYSENIDLLDEYRTYFKAFKKAQSDLKVLKEKQAKAQQEFDYKSFLYAELDEAQLTEGEYKLLEDELDTLSNADKIMQQLVEAIQKIGLEEAGAIDQLTQSRAALSKLTNYGSQYKELYNRVHSVLIELEDVSSTLSDLSETVDADPLTLERHNNRLQLLHSLMKKHQVDSLEQLIEIKDSLDIFLQEVEGADGTAHTLEQKIEKEKSSALAIAAQLNKKRKNSIPNLIAHVEQILGALGMPNAQLKIELTEKEVLDLSGDVDLEFLFSANKGSELKPLGKAASGGELSRVMLALKSVLSNHKQLPTLIFDEIDTGVSGDIAVKMGNILKQMGQTMQLISITHLPQIAGQGNAHFKVFKKDVSDKTQTFIEPLDKEERIKEIAGMLGGGNTESSAAIEHAKNLLN